MTAVLIAGTTSDAGKSIVVAGLCRALARRGIKVAPFKAQNMSNNSVVCPAGGEIGRAQGLQAVACGLAPRVEFNPILLKPGSDRTSQLVVNGRAQGTVTARNYVEHRSYLRGIAADCLAALQDEFEVVICEGAGSPAEINLRATDVANFGLAEIADLPVYLVGDIDRGGVLAHLYGTHQIVADADRERIKGFIVNKFRGDVSILQPGLAELAELTGVPTVAVLPFIDGLWVDAEDSLQSVVGMSVGPSTSSLGQQRLRVAAIRLPRVSNATDIEALACEPGVSVTWTHDPDFVAEADLVVIPGSKATVSDLNWLRETGLAEAITSRTAPTLGICGGFQMMCALIDDPVESDSTTPGLGLFDIDILFHPEKTLLHHVNGAYEIHHGQIARSSEAPWLDGEGAMRENFRGTHRHGQLEDNDFRREFLRWVADAVRKPKFVVAPDTDFAAERMRQLDLIADAIDEAWDLDEFLAEINRGRGVR
ncbi:cobyric acid synthase [Staphylococcus chromogenes]|nr:cobyric acid synthase [Staphylococcus chromogenes]